jgi:hypothetical protein
MKPTPDTISIDEATSLAETEAADDVIAWQARKLKERKKQADEGRFASPEAVKAVVRKFIPNG